MFDKRRLKDDSLEVEKDKIPENIEALSFAFPVLT